MARPRKVIDQKQFEGLCQLQCTQQEICDFIGVSDKTLEKWCKETYSESFSEVFSKKRVGGKISLRRQGFQLAKTNAAVWIFHAKNHLLMKDNPEQTDSTEKAKPRTVIIQEIDAS